ncbi:MAG: fimbrillin family protein [Rikenellaceae bacterium]
MKKLLFCLSALFAVACTEGIEEDVTLDANTGAVNFEATMTTRATDTEFENGDEISVVAYSADGTAYAQNVLYTYSGALFSSDSPIMKTESSQELSYLAVYPYTTIGDDKKVNFSVKEDQSAENNYTLSDLLSSSVEATSSTSPQLIFTHLLSKLVINIDSEDVTTADAVATLNAVTDIEYNLESAEYTTSGDVKAITMASDSDTSYKALLVPQVIAANSVFGSVVFGGTTYEFTFGSDITIESGYVYTLNATIVGDKITFGNAIINDWNEVLLEDTTEDESIPENYILFDELYPADYVGSELVSNIADVIAGAEDGTVILFEKESYNFDGQKLDITRSNITLSGVEVEQSEVNLETVGAMEIATTFDNVSRFLIKADNIGFRNLKLTSYEGNTYYGVICTKPSVSTDGFGVESVVDEYTGLNLYNVYMDGDASGHIYTGSCPGGTFEHVSFMDFSSMGYAADRNTKEDDAEPSIFKYCWFEGDSDGGYNCRGITFDAGNTEYPVVWDVDTKIENCHFVCTGVAFSRCKNASITNCVFENSKSDMDMIHAEEYSTDIFVDSNEFYFTDPNVSARGFYIDRESQFAGEITITNNKFDGRYSFILSAYSPDKLTFENNDLTNAYFEKDGYAAFSLTFQYSKDEAVPSSDYFRPSKNLTFRNNTGFSENLLLYAEAGDTSNTISHSGNIKITEVEPLVQPFDDGVYYIRNYKSGEYLVVSSSSSYIGSTVNKGESAQWELSFYEDWSYTIKSVNTGNYLEAFKINMLSNVTSGTMVTPSDLSQSSNYVGKSRVPNFLLVKQSGVTSNLVDSSNNSDKGDYMLFYPGGNERKSRVIIGSDGYAELELARDTSSNVLDYDDESLWQLVKVDD